MISITILFHVPEQIACPKKLQALHGEALVHFASDYGDEILPVTSRKCIIA